MSGPGGEAKQKPAESTLSETKSSEDHNTGKLATPKLRESYLDEQTNAAAGKKATASRSAQQLSPDFPEVSLTDAKSLASQHVRASDQPIVHDAESTAISHKTILADHEISELFFTLLKTTDDPKIAVARAAIDADFSLGELRIPPYMVNANGGDPNEMIEAAVSLLKELSGAQIDVRRSKFHGDWDVIKWKGSAEEINTHLKLSKNPVVARFLADKEVRIRNPRYKGSPYTENSLNPEALAIVQARKFMPEILPDGSVAITTRVDHTGFPMNTAHFTFNHKVAPHKDGSWEDSPITIIAPFNDMVDKNGAPANLSPIDTFWTNGLDTKCIIPKATLVLPGDSSAPLYSLGLRQTTYKDNNYSCADVRLLIESLTPYQAQDFLSSAAEILTPHNLNLSSMLSTSSGTTRLLNCFPVGNEPAQAELQNLVRNTTNRLAIDKTLEYLGYEVQAADAFAWTRRSDVYPKTVALAKELGTVSELHSTSIYGHLDFEARMLSDFIATMEEDIMAGHADSQQPLLRENESHLQTPNGERLLETTWNSWRQGDWANRIAIGSPIKTDDQTRYCGMMPYLRQLDANTQAVYSDWLKRQRPKIEEIEKYFGRTPDKSPLLQAIDKGIWELDARVWAAEQLRTIMPDLGKRRFLIEPDQLRPSKQEGADRPANSETVESIAEGNLARELNIGVSGESAGGELTAVSFADGVLKINGQEHQNILSEVWQTRIRVLEGEIKDLGEEQKRTQRKELRQELEREKAILERLTNPEHAEHQMALAESSKIMDQVVEHLNTSGLAEHASGWKGGQAFSDMASEQRGRLTALTTILKNILLQTLRH